MLVIAQVRNLRVKPVMSSSYVVDSVNLLSFVHTPVTYATFGFMFLAKYTLEELMHSGIRWPRASGWSCTAMSCVW